MAIEDLKKLPPEERIKKLKELAEKDKKEIEEAMKLIKESSLEAEEKAKLLEKIPIPQIKAVNIESLFTKEEKQAFKTMRYSSDEHSDDTEEHDEKEAGKQAALEETVAQTQPKISQAQIEAQKTYFHELGTEALHKKREQLYAAQEQSGYLSSDQQAQLYNIQEEFEQRESDFKSGSYKTASEKVAQLLSGENKYQT